MPDDQLLERLGTLMQAVSGDHWEVIEWKIMRGDVGEGKVGVVWDSGQRAEMDIHLAYYGAPENTAHDIQFIGNSRSDMQRLLLALRGETQLRTDELASIEARCHAATPAPWKWFLGSWAIGGPAFIQMDEENEADRELYPELWGKEAPDADIEFIARARNHLPDLVALYREKFEIR
ncbi:MAG TPA: hypothetical protein VFN35_15030 [Ktedonobacteraceae bacterium]|nr:hypothetical protein [Ktedonobacteraceae bacterium]